MDINVTDSFISPRAYRFLLLASVLCAALFCPGTSLAEETALQRFAFEEPCMGTLFRVVLFAPNERVATAAARAAFDRIELLDAMMTDYNESSELMRLCAGAGGPAVHVSDEIFDVLVRAKEFNTTTRGAFDVTVGPVVRVWRKARKEKTLPDPGELAKAKALVGMSNVLLDEKTHCVRLALPGMKLDFGGIAKGYAVDQALALLKQRGFPNALVVGGGDVGVGEPPPGKGWTVDVKSLNTSEKEPVRLLLKNAGVSTSGDAEQHLDANGKRYSHIIDPKTGKAIEGRSSVTLVAPNCTTSDALAKTGVLGIDAAIDVINATPGAAVFIMIEDAAGVRTHESTSWKAVPKVK